MKPKVVYIHPESRLRTLAAYQWIVYQAPSCACGFTLSKAEIQPWAFLEGLLSALRSVHPRLGSHTQALMETETTTIGEIAEALACDLRGPAERGLTIVIDHRPGAEKYSEPVFDILECLLARLPTGITFLLIADDGPALPWATLVVEGSIVVWSDDLERRRSGIQWVTKATGDDLHQVQAQGFGAGAVLVDGSPVTHWQGRLVKQLFFFFLEHKRATDDQVAAALWPDMSPAKVMNTFSVARHRLKRAFGFPVLKRSGEYWELNPEVEWSYDVWDYELLATLSDGRLGQENGRHDIYHNEWRPAMYLRDWDTPWVVTTRKRLQQVADGRPGNG